MATIQTMVRVQLGETKTNSVGMKCNYERILGLSNGIVLFDRASQVKMEIVDHQVHPN